MDKTQKETYSAPSVILVELTASVSSKTCHAIYFPVGVTPQFTDFNDKPILEFVTAADASSKYGFATVNGIQGLILLPDEWTGPTMVVTHASFGENTITSSDWLTYWEPKGAVFLPVTGGRMGTAVSRPEEGLYWTSTESGAVLISPVLKESGYDGVYNDPSYSKAAGFAVRLVRDIGFKF